MKYKFAIGSLMTVIVFFLVASCERNGGVFEDELNVLGTFGQISIVGLSPEEAHEAARAAEKDLEALDYIGYTFEAEGELHQLNEAIAQGRSMTVSDGLAELIMDAKMLSSASDGAFNPAAGELTAFWEFHCDKDECSESPYPDEVQRLVDDQVAKIINRHPSMDDLIIKGNKVSSQNRLVKLEFGDMIRGLALDKGIEHLGRIGVANAMINIGGSVRTIGTRGDHDWWIGIPDATGKHLIASIENIDDQSVVTVRAFDKSFGKHGLVYRHIVDPRSGMPVKDVKSVTVMHDNALIANASAVTILIAGIKDWKMIADKMDVHKILVITKDGTIYTSPAMEHIIHWKQGIEHQHLVP
ncbi:MAG: FAD:protein FMN transferase [Pseudomonadota bacterium]|nr:FAD:protein FMN transferase [Pseudomonadota bacterium]